MPHGKVEHSARQITPSASVLDRLRRPLDEERAADLQALEALSNAELERISNLDFSFFTDNFSNDNKNNRAGSQASLERFIEDSSPAPSSPIEEKTMEEGQKSGSSRSTRGVRSAGSGDASRGRQPRQATPRDPGSRSMSSSSTDASGERTGLPSHPPRRTTSGSRNVANSMPSMSSASGGLFHSSPSSFAHAPGTFLPPPTVTQNVPQPYSQLFGSGASAAPSLPLPQALARTQSQAPAPSTPTLTLPGVDYSNLTPQQQQMLIQAHHQVLMVAAQQQQQRQQQQQQQSQGTSELLSHFPSLDLSQWTPQGQYQQDIFAGLSPDAGLPSNAFPLPTLSGTRHDGTQPQSSPATILGTVAASPSSVGMSPPETPSPAHSNFPSGGRARNTSRASATTPAAPASSGSSAQGAGPSSGDGVMHDDGDDDDDAEGVHMSEDKRRRNTAASGMFLWAPTSTPKRRELLIDYLLLCLFRVVLFPNHRFILLLACDPISIARFRLKKKQRIVALEQTITDLEGRAGDLEKEAGELRKENSWLKEMVIMKGRRAMGATHAGEPSVGGDGGGGVAVASSSTGGIAPSVGAGTSRSGTTGRNDRSHRAENSSRPSRQSQGRRVPARGEDDDDDDDDEDEEDD